MAVNKAVVAAVTAAVVVTTAAVLVANNNSSNTNSNNSSNNTNANTINSNSLTDPELSKPEKVKDTLSAKVYSGFPTVYDATTNAFILGSSQEGQEKNRQHLKNLQPYAINFSSRNELERIYCPSNSNPKQNQWKWAPWEVPITITLEKDWCFYFTYQGADSRVGKAQTPNDQRGWFLIKQVTTPGVLTSLTQPTAVTTSAGAQVPAPETEQLTQGQKDEILSKIKEEFSPKPSTFLATNNFISSDYVACERERTLLEQRNPNRPLLETINKTSVIDGTTDPATGNSGGVTTKYRGLPSCGYSSPLHFYYPYEYYPLNTNYQAPQSLFNVAITANALSNGVLPHREDAKNRPHAAFKGNHNYWVKLFDDRQKPVSERTNVNERFSAKQVFELWVTSEAPHIGYRNGSKWSLPGADSAYVFDRYLRCVPGSVPHQFQSVKALSNAAETVRKYIGGCRTEFGMVETEEDFGKAQWTPTGAKVYIALRGEMIYQIHTDSPKLFFEHCRLSPFVNPNAQEKSHQCRVDSVAGADNIIDQLITNNGKLSDKLTRKLQEWDKIHTEEVEKIVKAFTLNNSCGRSGDELREGRCHPKGDYFWRNTGY